MNIKFRRLPRGHSCGQRAGTTSFVAGILDGILMSTDKSREVLNPAAGFSGTEITVALSASKN